MKLVLLWVTAGFLNAIYSFVTVTRHDERTLLIRARAPVSYWFGLIFGIMVESIFGLISIVLPYVLAAYMRWKYPVKKE